MTCRDAEALLPAYVDGELDVAASAQMQAHVDACPTCAAALARAEALRAALAAASLRHAPPSDLERRVRTAIRRQIRPGAPLAPRAWRWAALPAVAAMASALTWMLAVTLPSSGGRPALVDELVAGHVRSLMVDHLVDVPSADQHTVRPWFNGKIDFAPPVADFAGSGFALVGGRVDYVGRRPVAALVYRHGQHLVNVFIWPAGGESSPQALSADGYHLMRWNDGGLQYWAVSDLNAGELGDLVELIRRAH